MGLDRYREKRQLDETPEPAGGLPSPGLPRFVVQLHRATRLHHDFRLENQGVLKSWAVPKGPSMNPSDKRLAMMVEDHPMDYRRFEGIIPKGNYGAGTVMVWDEGEYAAPDAHTREEVEHAVKLGLHKGHVGVFLNGHKLRGLFDVIKLKGREENAWLLVKRPDEFATTDAIEDVARSVLSARTLEEIRSEAPSEGRVWHSDRRPEEVDFGDAPEAPMPRNLKPMLATEVDKPFDRDGWLFEVKWDGYRAIAEVEAEGQIQLFSRNGLSFAERYPSIVDGLRRLGHAAILDGEVVAVDDDGVSQFQWLQDYARRKRGDLLYYVFDLLYLDGRDLTCLPLKRRKELLRQILPADGVIRLSDHVEGQGRAFFEAVKTRGLEGVMAKNGAGAYEAGRRGRDWLKIKCLLSQIAVIGGYTEPRNSRKHFGALVLGVYDGDDLVYIGHTGGGFDEASLDRLMGKLEPLRRESCPFVDLPKTNMPVTWVQPEIVCDVVFRGWTDSALLRQPVFKSLRPDVDPGDVYRDAPDATPKHPVDTVVPSPEAARGAYEERARGMVSNLDTKAVAGVKEGNMGRRSFAAKSRNTLFEIEGHLLKLTNLDKVLWPEDGYTKGELIDYYRSVSEFILPYLVNRPESLNRHPNGIEAKGFFQKDMPASTPAWLETVEVESGSQKKTIRYLLCQDEATLVFMANLACIEINPWNSSIPHLDRPDYAVVDLDPHEIGFDAVIETAQTVKAVLNDLGVEGYPKTSGATGIHIYIPLGACYGGDQARRFAELVASLVHQRLPKLTSLERMPVNRVGRVYLDFLQNRDGQTLAAAYSVRPRPGATVSTPLRWEELTADLDPATFTIRTTPDRLAKAGDLWKPVLGPPIDMGAALQRLR